MGLDFLADDILMQILSSLIVASIIGAATSFTVMIRCVHRQANDLALMKKATIIVLSMIAKDTERLHGQNHNLGDIDNIFKELMDTFKN